MEGDCTALVIDNGSGTCKAGFAGDDAPRSLFPQVACLPSTEAANRYVGSVQGASDIIGLKYPVERGFVQDWDDMEKVWHHILHDQLDVSIDQHPLLVSETPLNRKESREIAAQVMFENFGVPAAQIILQPTLCLYDYRFRTCIVLDSGDGVTHVTAFYEGSPIVHSSVRLDLAGADITDLVFKRLGGQENPDITREYMYNLKHNVCYISLDPAQEVSQTDATNYELPDGNQVTIGDERFLIPEALFQPHLIGRHANGIVKMIRECINRCDLDLQPLLRRKVVLAGGTTLLPGFVDRLRQELNTTAHLDVETKVYAPSERQCSTWIGGSILASLSTFQSLWCTKQEYNETGPAIIQHKRI